MVDHFAVRLAGVEIDRRQKAYYYDFYEAVVRHPLPIAPLGLVDEFNLRPRMTDRELKFSITGPHSLVKRIRDECYHDERAFALDLARVLNAELKALVGPGATFIQIDEPYLSGFPEDLVWGVEALNALVDGVEAHIGLHVCYGNRYGKPSWEGSYRFLFPHILDAHVDQLLLEFARKGTDDLDLFKRVPQPLRAGHGRDRRQGHADRDAERSPRASARGSNGAGRSPLAEPRLRPTHLARGGLRQAGSPRAGRRAGPRQPCAARELCAGAPVASAARQLNTTVGCGRRGCGLRGGAAPRGEHELLDVAALAHQVVDLVGVVARTTSCSMIGPASSSAVT